MCGIIGIIAKDNSNITLQVAQALKSLEYRGYDSFGLSYIVNNRFEVFKSLNAIEDLITELKEKNYLLSKNAIGHTRWATHGKVCLENTHPFISDNFSLALNGIVENYMELKKVLLEEGYRFSSSTDAEVILMLLEKFLKQDCTIEESVNKIIFIAKGSFSFVFQYLGQKNHIYCVHNGLPLIVGFNNNFNMIASDINTCLQYSSNYLILEPKDFMIINNTDNLVIKNKGQNVSRETFFSPLENVTKDEGQAFDSYMIKEIYEQPNVIAKCIEHYSNQVINLKNIFDKVSNLKSILIIGCGSSYFSACLAKYYFEEVLSDINIEVEIASEILYTKKNYSPKSTLVIFLSQSGETKDVLTAFDFIQEKRIYTIAAVNNIHSTLGKKSDLTLDILAGPEYSVASTKGFSNQYITLLILAQQISKQMKNNMKLFDLKYLSNGLAGFLNNLEVFEIAKEVNKYDKIIFIGKGILVPVIYEGSLKLKEITYINSQAIAAGELKHGPLALIDHNTLVIALVTKYDMHIEKVISNIEEVKSRNGNLIIISEQNISLIDDIDAIKFDFVDDGFTNILKYIFILQLLAYNVAKLKNLNVDKPRNLAKSVTVD